VAPLAKLPSGEESVPVQLPAAEGAPGPVAAQVASFPAAARRAVPEAGVVVAAWSQPEVVAVVDWDESAQPGAAAEAGPSAQRRAVAGEEAVVARPAVSPAEEVRQAAEVPSVQRPVAEAEEPGEVGQPEAAVAGVPWGPQPEVEAAEVPDEVAAAVRPGAARRPAVALRDVAQQPGAVRPEDPSWRLLFPSLFRPAPGPAAWPARRTPCSQIAALSSRSVQSWRAAQDGFWS
jgi:hypothetical protein